MTGRDAADAFPAASTQTTRYTWSTCGAAVASVNAIVAPGPWATVPTRAGWFRSALSRTVSRLYQRLTGQDVHTFTCLYRAYRRDVIERTQFRATGFAAVTELMLRGMLSGCSVREVPMELGARSLGESKLQIGEAILSHLALLAMTAMVVAGRRARGRIGLA